MNMSHQTYLHSNQVTLEIRSELPALDTSANVLLTSAFVPGADVSRESYGGDISRRIFIEKATSLGITEKGEKDVIVVDDWNDAMPLHLLVHLLYSIVQREHLARDNYSLHSSCVVNGDIGYLFIGHSGSGKTTTALEMVRKFDFRWYSGNKTLVEFSELNENDTIDERPLAINAIAGTRPVTLEADNAAGESLFQNQTALPFVDRKLMLLKEEHEYTSASVQLGAIILAQVNDGARKFSRLSPSAAAISLFPFFYDYFNMDIHMPGGKMYNASFVDSDHRNNLKRRLVKICADLPVIQASGSFDFMTEKVGELASETV